MKRLLIIEDDTDALEMAAFTFENSGYEVIRSAKEMAVEEVAALKPHIIVIGFSVNGAPGNNICTKLKANEATQPIPVIIYSANHDLATVSRSSCAEGHIARPYELDDFVYLVQRIALS